MLGAVGWVAGLVCAFPRETMAIYDLMQAGRTSEAREIYRWFMPLLHLDVSQRFVQNIKLTEHMVRGTSTDGSRAAAGTCRRGKATSRGGGCGRAQDPARSGAIRILKTRSR